MAIHSYTRVWLHLIWSTLDEEKILPLSVRKKLSSYFYTYAQERGIFMRINYVMPEHVHILIDLP
ncbi:MAG: hypothetical protein DRH04_11380, partial [Deltaproteobacteria bacterium]